MNLVEAVTIGSSAAPEYNIQNFWIYLINAHNSTPEEVLHAFYQKPADENSLDQVLRNSSDYPPGYGFADAYWGWVRNQAFEANVRKGNNKLNKKCKFDRNALSDIETITFNPGTSASEVSESYTIDPETADVVKIVFENSGTSPYVGNVIADETTFGSAASKFYPSIKGASNDCLNRRGSNSGMNVFEQTVKTCKDSVYVLLGNSSIGDVADYKVSVSHEELNFAIKAPESGDTFEEGEIVSFEASVTPPRGVKEYSTTWKTSGTYRGIRPMAAIPVFSDLNSVQVSTGMLCPGEHTIKASVSGNSPKWKLTDEIDIKIINAKPEVQITSDPSDEVSVGQKVSLYAHASDVSCTSGSRMEKSHDINWTINGRPVAQGASLYYTVTESLGREFLVQARYQDEGGKVGKSREITFSVRQGGNDKLPPSVIITNPEDNADRHSSTGEISLKGEATDPDGGNTNTYHGLSATTDLWPDLIPPNLDIKLTVTDDEGQTASTQISIDIIPGL